MSKGQASSPLQSKMKQKKKKGERDRGLNWPFTEQGSIELLMPFVSRIEQLQLLSTPHIQRN